MKNLENFIHMHKNEFDVYQPGSEVWAGISSGLTASVPLSKLVKSTGTGFKSLILGFAVTSAMLAAGIWVYQSDKSQQTAVHVTQSTNVKEAPEVPRVSDKVPVPENMKQVPSVIGKETSGHKEAGKPTTEEQNPQPVANDILPALPVAEPGDSVYSGIKTLTLKSFGYNFKIKRSDSKMTRVHILKPGRIRDKETHSELVLKIAQKGSELVFEYENEDKRQGWRANYETVSTGEIELLIPDGDISRITTASSNIDLNGYAAPALSTQSASGNVYASDIQAKLSISSASGNQYLAGISGELNCSAASGDISLKTLQGNVKIETSSGKITLLNSRGDMTCGSASGNIRLDGVQGKLDIHTSSGNIGGESVSLVESCNIQTISGNVDLGIQNDANDLSFDLSAISGRMKINKGNIVTDGKQSLRAGSGKIPVTAKSISGNQVYR